jgi:hypothetical protein
MLFGLKGEVAAASNGILFTWGVNTQGETGHGNTTANSSPIQVGAGNDWAILNKSYGKTSVAIKSDSTLWAWGDGTTGGTGQGNTTDISSPVQIGSASDWRKIAGGTSNSGSVFAINSSGELWATGYNSSGVLGNGATSNLSNLTQIGALTDWASVTTSQRYSAGIKTDGTLWTWGSGAAGYLGHGNTTDYSSPVQVGALTTWSKVIAFASGGFISLTTTGKIYTWGRNHKGQLGLGDTTTRSSPVQVGALTTWAEIGAGRNTSLAIKTDGTLWSWGNGPYGTQGHNNTTAYSSPVQVGALTDWATLGASHGGAKAVKTDGTMWTWGLFASGDAGQGGTSNISSPVQLGSSVQWKAFDTILGHVNGGIIL